MQITFVSVFHGLPSRERHDRLYRALFPLPWWRRLWYSLRRLSLRLFRRSL